MGSLNRTVGLFAALVAMAGFGNSKMTKPDLHEIQRGPQLKDPMLPGMVRTGSPMKFRRNTTNRIKRKTNKLHSRRKAKLKAKRNNRR